MAELFISYGSVGLSTAKEHKPCTRLTALRHNHRELQAELGCAGDIDASRCHLNIVLAGHTSAGECEAHALALFNGAKLKRNHMQALEIVFSLPHDTGIDVREYFGACLAWAKTHHALPVLSAVVHLDQAKPHMHLLLLPIDGNGEYMRGVNPSKVEVRKATESFAQHVALPAGLQRPGAKLGGETRKLAIQAVYDTCARMFPAMAGMRAFRSAVAKDPRQWIDDFGIDVNGLRSSTVGELAAPNFPTVGELRTTEKTVPRTCVGELNQTTFTAPQKAPPEVPPAAPAVADMGVYKRLTHGAGGLFCTLPARLRAARHAQRVAIEKPCNPRKVAAWPVVRVGDDGIVRERDELAHDLSAWD